MRVFGIVASLMVLASAHAAHHFEGVKQFSVQGKIKLELGVGGKRSHTHIPKAVKVEKVGTSVVLSTDSDALQVVKIYSRDKFRELQSLNLMEESQLVAKKIHAHQLDITSETSGPILLSGVAGIRKITHSGTGKLEAFWLDSKQLQVEASSGKVVIGGVVPQLYIHSSGDATVDASGLTAKYAWIKSDDTSYTKIRVSELVSMMGSKQSLVENYANSEFINELAKAESALIHIKQ